ncbi:MAG: N-acetylmuramoyl-L-alanine amidase [Acutalibacteraceae bacterium]
MKNILKRGGILLLVLCLVGFPRGFAADIKGDMNSDGKIKLSDVRQILRIASAMKNVDDGMYSRADMNSDGTVDLSDVKAALGKAVDLDPKWTLNKITQITPETKQSSSNKMTFCKVTSYSGETFPESPVNDTSNPLYSPLPKGTYDYVKSGPVTDSASGKKYYVLKSGRRAYAEDVKVFTGYQMPYNKAQLRDPVTYEDDSTKFYIALDWRVPFNVTIKPQEYESGYGGRVFNVKDGNFTGKYMDITFYYTKSAEGSLTFPDSDTIKSCKWFVDSEKKTATLRIYFRGEGDFYGYSATYNKNNLLVISVKEPTKTLKGRTVEIDPGHGGAQPGAGSGTGVYEKDITYKIAMQLKSYLEKAGATVILSRDDSDSVPEIEERRINALKNDADLFVSIHLDSSASKSVHGSSVYYYKNYSAPLAKAISKNLPKTINADTGYKMTDRGSHFYPFKVTRIENCPAVLVECGFISNTNAIYTPPSDAKSKANCDFNFLNSSLGQKTVAKGIYKGILEYFGI